MQEELYNLYKDTDACFPFVGKDFQDSAKKAFRVLVVGLNAYLKDSDWDSPRIPKSGASSWSSDWWHALTHKFHTDARLAALILAERAINFDVFDSLVFDDPESTLFLNFIPRYLTEDTSNSKNIKKSDFNGTAELWREIMDLLAKKRVFPNAILVLGKEKKVWTPIWQSLHEKHCKSLVYTPTLLRDECHVAARCDVKIGNDITPLLLYRAPHPSACKQASPASDIYRWFLQGNAATILTDNMKNQDDTSPKTTNLLS